MASSAVRRIHLDKCKQTPTSTFLYSAALHLGKWISIHGNHDGDYRRGLRRDWSCGLVVPPQISLCSHRFSRQTMARSMFHTVVTSFAFSSPPSGSHEPPVPTKQRTKITLTPFGITMGRG